MNIKILIPCCFILLVILNSKSFSQNDNYNFENWHGKKTESKKYIGLKENLISNYKMSARKGNNNHYVSFKLPLYESDTLKKGILKIKIFSSSAEAQLALVEHLNSISSPKIPSRIDDNLKFLDVAFGMEYNGILRTAFTKNNVFVVMEAPVDNAYLIIHEIANSIENSPNWRDGDKEPNIVFTK